MRLQPYGEHALLAELDDPHDVPAARAALADLEGVVDAVAGACTVLAVYEPGRGDAVRALLTEGTFASLDIEAGRTIVTVPVDYSGPDLDEVASLANLSVDQVVEVHAGGDYVVRFCGFAPGFAYLDGLDERLHVARRGEPRTSVPAGAVGIAGEFTGVYPRPSPGGWQLLGRTDVELWRPDHDRPALLSPGTRVKFEPT